MTFALETTACFDRQFKKLSPSLQAQITAYLLKHADGASDPRTSGKALTGNLAGLWRYRVGDYRIICDIQDAKLIVLALEIGHRRDIYKKH
jgi:addiction module toxin, RelE/StbE family